MSLAQFAGDRGEGERRVMEAVWQGSPGRPGQQVAINGSVDLSSSIQANDGGRVHGIWLNEGRGTRLYTYNISVEASGPSGMFSGSMYLGFVDETGDIYHLSIWNSAREFHIVGYNSDRPAITNILWANHDFTKKEDL